MINPTLEGARLSITKQYVIKKDGKMSKIFYNKNDGSYINNKGSKVNIAVLYKLP